MDGRAIRKAFCREVLRNMSATGDETFLSVTEAAKILNLGRTQILRLCNQGRLAGAQKVGNGWIIPKSSVETYTPGEKGFAAVWKKRRTDDISLQSEIVQAVATFKTINPKSQEAEQKTCEES